MGSELLPGRISTRGAFHADPSAETLPWPNTEAGRSAHGHPPSPTVHRAAIWSALVVMACGLGVAALVLVPVLLGGEPAHSAVSDLRGAMVAGVLALLLAMAAVAALALLQWRARLRSAATLRRTARELQRGAWRAAVDGMREVPPAEPSGFHELAAQVESVIGESERRWQARADLSLDWYWETDEAHRLSVLQADAPLVKPAGRAVADLLGRSHDELGFMHPAGGSWDEFNQVLDRHQGFRDMEFVVDGLGGRVRGWVALSGRPRRHRNGQFSGYEGIGRDITEQKEAWRRLQASEQRYAVMAGLSADWYWATDAEHRFVPADAETLRRFGTATDTFAGHTRWELHPQALTEAQWADHRADLAARKHFRSLEYAARHADGSLLWLSASGAPRLDEHGRFLGYHGVARDITQRKNAEHMLLQHNRELQAAVAARTRELELANRDLDAFTRHLAHELRTPMGQVQQLAQLFSQRLGAQLPADAARLLQLQVQAVNDMQATLEALLELARSSSEAIERSTVDVSRLAADVIATLPAIERVAPVAWQVQPGLQAWASESQLRILLANLLGNAAKFTRRVAAPRVHLASVQGPDGTPMFQVRDNGSGFDPAHAVRLFQPYRRQLGDGPFQGTGIGLSMVQRIVQRHGGSIRAHGEPGQGACFEFSLGLRPDDALRAVPPTRFADTAASPLNALKAAPARPRVP